MANWERTPALEKHGNVVYRREEKNLHYHTEHKQGRTIHFRIENLSSGHGLVLEKTGARWVAKVVEGSGPNDASLATAEQVKFFREKMRESLKNHPENNGKAQVTLDFNNALAELASPSNSGNA